MPLVNERQAIDDLENKLLIQPSGTILHASFRVLFVKGKDGYWRDFGKDSRPDFRVSSYSLAETYWAVTKDLALT